MGIVATSLLILSVQSRPSQERLHYAQKVIEQCIRCHYIFMRASGYARYNLRISLQQRYVQPIVAITGNRKCEQLLSDLSHLEQRCFNEALHL